MTDDIKDCFRILDLDTTASPDDVKKSYRELAKVWHPDRFQHDKKLLERGQEKLKKINAAYNTLKQYFASADYRRPQAEPKPPPAAKDYSYSRPKKPSTASPSKESFNEAYLYMTCFRCKGNFRFPEKMEGQFTSCPLCGGFIELRRGTKVKNPTDTKPKPSHTKSEPLTFWGKLNLLLYGTEGKHSNEPMRVWELIKLALSVLILAIIAFAACSMAFDVWKHGWKVVYDNIDWWNVIGLAIASLIGSFFTERGKSKK